MRIRTTLAMLALGGLCLVIGSISLYNMHRELRRDHETMRRRLENLEQVWRNEHGFPNTPNVIPGGNWRNHDNR